MLYNDLVLLRYLPRSSLLATKGSFSAIMSKKSPIYSNQEVIEDEKNNT